MLGWIANPATLPGLTLPPYRTGGALDKMPPAMRLTSACCRSA